MAAEDSKQEELVEELMLSVGKMVRGMRAMFRREMERYDVTLPQFHMLKFVRDGDGITVMELSLMLMISAPTTSRMIDGLCSKGLLEKEKDEHDHRVTRLRLSAQSEGLLKALTDLQDNIWLEVFAEEDTAELQRTVSHIGRITDKWLEIAGNREKER